MKIATTTATTSCNSSSTYHVAAINFTKFWFIAPTRRAPDASMVRSAASGICWHSFACALAVSFSSYCVSLSVSNVCFLYILFFYIFFFQHNLCFWRQHSCCCHAICVAPCKPWGWCAAADNYMHVAATGNKDATDAHLNSATTG